MIYRQMQSEDRKEIVNLDEKTLNSELQSDSILGPGLLGNINGYTALDLSILLSQLSGNKEIEFMLRDKNAGCNKQCW